MKSLLMRRANLWLLLLSLVRLPICISQVPAALDGTGQATKLILDDMVHYFEGEEYDFPDKQFHELTECFSKYNNPQLLEAQDAGWRKFLEYYKDPYTQWENTPDVFFQESKIDQDRIFGDRFSKYEINQPCNFVSNIAYYNGAIRVCEKEWKTFNATAQSAMQRIFASQAMASSLYHGASTGPSSAYDAFTIVVALNSMYQLGISSIESESRAFRAGIPFYRQTPVEELVDVVSNLTLDSRYPESVTALYSLPLPDSSVGYEQTVATLIYFACAVTVPFGICRDIMDSLSSGVSAATAEFIFEEYEPALLKILEDENLPLPPRIGWPLFGKVLGVAIGFINALLYQEFLLDTDCLTDTGIGRFMGSFLGPLVEFGANLIHNIGNTEQQGYNGKGESYPGSKFCNRNSPHAYWHQLSSDSLFEAFTLFDDVNSEIIKHQARNARRKLALQSPSQLLRGLTFAKERRIDP